jgi:hypothetical protein
LVRSYYYCNITNRLLEGVALHLLGGHDRCCIVIRPTQTSHSKRPGNCPVCASFSDRLQVPVQYQYLDFDPYQTGGSPQALFMSPENTPCDMGDVQVIPMEICCSLRHTVCAKDTDGSCASPELKTTFQLMPQTISCLSSSFASISTH